MKSILEEIFKKFKVSEEKMFLSNFLKILDLKKMDLVFMLLVNLIVIILED